ncbi:enoyl-CoA hydratase/isomerase family protein [Zavarzinia sp. CC-PAN008]|uniref:enoyl-CoA hydratase/isomerase family protein n=1 Tax=Zavarzinia sp. CC-PAN008 TaxID=3243332 RepID=UPI003F7461C1
MTLVLRHDQDGIATLTLNRPDKLNALTVALFEELRAHVETLATQTETVGVVLLKGAGKCFSAGNDLGAIAAGDRPRDPRLQGTTIEKLANLPQPVIVGVHGHCYTGGLELALAADILVAAESAKFADTHGKWALTPVWGMSQRLPRRVGPYKAREMMLTSRTYSGRQAEAMGLANVCVADDAFEAEIDSLARTMVANSWFSLRANKRLLIATDGMTLGEGLSWEVHRTEGLGPDAAERIAGFGNKTAKVG